MPNPNTLFKALATACMLTLLWVAAPALAAKLAPESQEIRVGDLVVIRVEQARASADVKWRSSAELEFDVSQPGQGRFRAVAPGRALVTATIDGELASTFIQVQPGAGSAPVTAGGPKPVKVEVPKLRAIIAADTPAVTQPPRLRELLPENAFVYLRVPSPWGLLGAPKGNIYARAVGSSAYAQTIDGLRTGFVNNLLPEVPPEGQLFLSLLMEQMRSPLELAVMPPAKAEASLPDSVITLVLDADTPEAANALLAGIAEQAPGIEPKIPMGEDGAGMLLVQGMPLQTYFAADEQRLYLSFTDPSAAPDPLNQWVAARQTVSDHPMYAAEAAIDASGQGLFAWVDPSPLMQTLEQLGQAQQVAALRAFGASEARSLALGLGGSGGKQRLKLLLDMPQVGFRSFLPAVNTELPLRTAGEPELVFMLGLPDPDDLALVENNLLGMMPPEDIQAYQAGKEMFQTNFGFSLEQLLGAFGDELLVVSDQAGYYLALRLRDPDLYQQILDQLLERFAPPYEQRELLGHTYHHLTLPSLAAADPELSGGMQDGDPISRRLASLPSHLYWTREGEYLLLASVPQTLIDYRYIDERVPLGDWLRQTQGIEPNGALLLASARSQGTPRLIYELNLWTLEALGDLFGSPVDLFALPSPRELGLPDSGSAGFQIASSPNQLAVELVYESNPLELLMAMGGLGTLTSAGIAAAVAIPAFEEYQNKAEIATELAEVQQLQQELIMFYVDQGRFPTAEEAQSLLSTLPGGGNMDLSLEPDTGSISAQIYVPGLSGGNLLIITPRLGDGGYIDWDCEGSTLDPAHLETSMLCN
jgi:hypothetical protein